MGEGLWNPQSAVSSDEIDRQTDRQPAGRGLARKDQAWFGALARPRLTAAGRNGGILA